jgi:transglutaminase-like putative cysteine protease
MKATPYTEEINKYLTLDKVIDYDNEAIKNLSDSLFSQAEDEIAYIKAAYEFVRDKISHSADAGEELITCSASEVLQAGHGICFAKSHLLVALLRCKGIPTGFCYQKPILDDETAPVLIYHGLIGVYIKELNKWVRLDARGNKEGVNAQFSLGEEQLAFPVRTEKGEEDGLVIFPDSDPKILEKFKKNKTRTQLWDDLPTELERRGMY